MTYADTLTVRRATGADLEALARLTAHAQAFHHRATPTRMRAVPAEGFLAHIGATLDDPDATYLLACEAGGEPVGCALVRVRRGEESLFAFGSRVALVDQLSVAPEAQRRGVGRALMGAVRALAEAAGAERIKLSVWAHNVGAQALYAGLGFAPVLHVLELPLDAPSPEREG